MKLSKTELKALAIDRWHKANRRKATIWLVVTLTILLCTLAVFPPLAWIPLGVGTLSYIVFFCWQYRGIKKIAQFLAEERERNENQSN